MIQSKRIVLGGMFALMAVLALAPVLVPGAFALTDAEKNNIIASTTLAIDNEITDNFYNVTSTVVGYTLLFGFVAVVLSLMWKGIRTLMGRV